MMEVVQSWEDGTMEMRWSLEQWACKPQAPGSNRSSSDGGAANTRPGNGDTPRQWRSKGCTAAGDEAAISKTARKNAKRKAKAAAAQREQRACDAADATDEGKAPSSRRRALKANEISLAEASSWAERRELAVLCI